MYTFLPWCLTPLVLKPPLCIFCMYLLINTPDLDNQLVRRVHQEGTVFRSTCFLHRVHSSLLTLKFALLLKRFAPHSLVSTAETCYRFLKDHLTVIITFAYFHKFIPFDLNTLHSNWNDVHMEQASEAVRETYTMCRETYKWAGVRQDQVWEDLLTHFILIHMTQY